MRMNSTSRVGSLLSRALEGAWRELPGPLELTSEELSRVARRVVVAGVGALVWRRVKDTPLAQVAGAEELRGIAQYLAMRDSVREHEVVTAFRAMRDLRIEPILLKGWSTARSYADPSVRPAGDVDLLIPAARVREVEAALEQGRIWADLRHEDFEEGPDRAYEDLRSRSVLVPLREAEIRVTGAEDHLRLCCNHLLRHVPGDGVSPLWLCDVAAAVEARPASFDWELCLGRDRRQRNWIQTVLGLAVRLLRMNPDGTPVEDAAEELPRWVVRTVLAEWDRAHLGLFNPPEAITAGLKNPLRMPLGLVQRWHDPLQARVRLKVRFNDTPRLPYQLAVYPALALGYRANRRRQAEKEAADEARRRRALRGDDSGR
jgi:hypothetical protein